MSVTLAWNPNTELDLAGYKVYYGTNSGVYPAVVDSGKTTTATISGLTDGVTYYFVVTAYNAGGSESGPSNEMSYNPAALNGPPTLDPIPDLVLMEDAGRQVVALTGISSGSTGEVQTLTVWAVSANPRLIPNPSIHYASPNTTGSISFQSVTNAYGSALITVTVDDGQTFNHSVSRTFQVTVVGINDAPTLSVLPSQTIPEDATLNLPFSIGDVDTPVESLRVWAESSFPALVSSNGILILGSGANRNLVITPNPDQSGIALIQLYVADGLLTTQSNFVLAVQAVNDPPTLDPIPNLAVADQDGPQTVRLTGISSGASNELQTLTVSCNSTNPDIIPQPAINYISPDSTGTLVFTPLPERYGTASILVSVDDGQTVFSRNFTITVGALKILAFTPTPNGGLTLSWESRPGSTYRVVSKTSFSEAAWINLSPDIVAEGAVTTWTDDLAAQQPFRFYKIQVVQ